MPDIYAVRIGKVPGYYMTWKECQEQTKGYKGAIFKKFETMEEAEAWMSIGSEPVDTNGIVAYVDGSICKETNQASYGIVFVKDNELLFKTNMAYVMSEEDSSANVGAELLGAMEACRLARINGWTHLKIGHDYQGISEFATGSWSAQNQVAKYYQTYMAEVQKHLTLQFIKIKGHTGHVWNEEADRLANLALGR